VTRESDLEGHLPAEKAPDSGAAVPVFRAAPTTSSQEDDQRKLDAETRGSRAEVPSNPIGGTDFALSIGYQIVRGVLPNKK
jgi:hypothetical protein